MHNSKTLSGWVRFAALAALLSPSTGPAQAQGGGGGQGAGAQHAPGAQGQAAIERAMTRVYPALVRIMVVTTEPMEGRLQKFQSAGSGAIISKDGHVVTNHHVAGKARRIVCDMPDGERIEAALVGTDPLADIAVVRLKLDTRKNPDKPLPVAEFGDSDRLKVGDVVLAMGSPAALTQCVTRGIVSNVRMTMGAFYAGMFRLDGEDVGSLVRWIGHDAQIFGGNSGGPLVNLEGDIVGINEIGIGGIGGAIPSNLAKDVAQQLIETGEVKRSWIGAACQPRLKSSSGASGVLVSSVVAGSPAAAAGVRPGDLITTYDGAPVSVALEEEMPLFNRMVLATPVGKTFSVGLMRDGAPIEVRLTTEARENQRGKDEEVRSWGVTARDFTRMSALEAQRPDKRGVRIGSVRSGGPAAEAKPPLDTADAILEINGKPVDNLGALRLASEDLTRDATERVPVLVAFERGTKKMLTVVRIGKESEDEKPLAARKAWLPVTTQVLTTDLAEAIGLKGKSGVRVVQVYPGPVGERSGLKVGDVILKLDGEDIRSSRPEENEVFTNMVRRRRIGDVAALDIVRDGRPMQLQAPCEAPPTPPVEAKRFKSPDFEFSVREMTVEDRVNRKIDEGEDRGVLVERVEMAGWAALARLSTGDILLSIDGAPTPDVTSVEAALKKATEARARRIVLFVKRGIHTVFLEIEPNWDGAK